MTSSVAIFCSKRRRLAALVCGVALAGSVTCADLRAAETGSDMFAACPLETGPARTVTSIVDAHTIALDDGSEVRLAGILPPAPPLTAEAPEVWLPEQAAKAALNHLVLGRPIVFGSSGPRSDRYGRILAQVFAGSGTARIWIQGQLLAEGHARASVVPADAACLDGLLAQERLARETRAGLWSNPAYAIRDAFRAFELYRWRSTYQIVAGRVVKVANIKGRIFLNFGADWRRDFTAGATRRTKNLTAAWAEKLKSLEGRRVRVRGWIERRNGPYIEITHPAQLELEADK